MFREHEIEYRINDSSAKAVITTPKFVKEVHAIKKNCKTLEHIIVVGDAQADELSFDASDERMPHVILISNRQKALISHFSATPQAPQVILKARCICIAGSQAMTLACSSGRTALETDLVAHTGDLNWIYPLGNGFLYTWRWGISTLVYDGKFDPVHWFELMEKYRVTNLASVPTAYRMFLTIKDAEKTYDLSILTSLHLSRRATQP